MIMGKLKEATRQQHEDLENTVDIMNQMFNLENYKTLLSKFYRFYSAIEPELENLDLSRYGYDFSARRKTPKLEKDLENLGLLDNAKGLPAWEKLPPLDSVEKAFGALYVLEGATLGGQIINRHLKQHLNLTPDNGGAFFNGYGEKTGAMWKEFMQSCNDFAAAANQDETIIASAKETFESFKKCFLEPISLSQTAN